MPEFIAAKRLTRSDLTFFEWHQKRVRAGNQKAINLNADVFERRLYPAIQSLASAGAVNVKIALHLLGPGLRRELVLTRKIIKGSDTYKNWRLNGEFIYDPDVEPDRFHGLSAGDFVILGFSGPAIAPDTVRADFVSVEEPNDVGLHRAIDRFMAGASMRQFTGADLDAVILAGGPPVDHPIRSVSLEMVALEEEASPPPGTAPTRRAGPPITREAVEAGRRIQSEIGYQGELLVKRYLERLKRQRRISDFEWTAETSATGPYDFRVVTTKGERLVDVKSTSLSFDREVHISLAELNAMIGFGLPYDLYRVFGVAGSTGQLRIASDVSSFASSLLAAIRLPAGVSVDSVSVKPEIMSFGRQETRLT